MNDFDKLLQNTQMTEYMVVFLIVLINYFVSSLLPGLTEIFYRFYNKQPNVLGQTPSVHADSYLDCFTKCSDHGYDKSDGGTCTGFIFNRNNNVCTFPLPEYPRPAFVVSHGRDTYHRNFPFGKLIAFTYSSLPDMGRVRYFRS